MTTATNRTHAWTKPVALGVWSLLALARAIHADEPKTREFLFTYRATVAGMEPGQTARVWLPMPPSNEEQTVTVVKEELPGKSALDREPKYGNEILYVEAAANRQGEVPLSITYRVKRREVHADVDGKRSAGEKLELYLKPDAKVPLGGKPLTLLEGRELPNDDLSLGRTLYDVVNGHMRYSKEGTGWGHGDAVWACDSGYGNCTDFHSLFISLARSEKLPAKFEIGFPLPPKRGAGEIPGYHCWAKFKPKGRGWFPVDISEANKNPEMRDYYFGNLTEDRVTFSVGRDLILVPKQHGPPINFLVYPYVEVNGKAYPADRIEREFTYRDVAPTAGDAHGGG